MKLRSHCPINFALEHFGDKWSLLIIRDLMFKGKRHYNEFFDSEEKISTSVLGDRLKSLEDAGIISKKADEIKKSRIKYSLTKKGIALLPTLVEFILWSEGYDNDTASDQDFILEAKENKAKLLSKLNTTIAAEHLAN